MNKRFMIDYFVWLRSMIGIDAILDIPVRNETEAQAKQDLLMTLFTIPFEVLLEEDAARAADGLALRDLYISSGVASGDEGDKVVETLETAPCSMLELLIGLAIRIVDIAISPEDVIENHVGYWFGRLLANITSGLDTEEHIVKACARINTRAYRPDGFGGIFPVASPNRDMRDVELWYQLQAWAKENTTWMA